MCMGLESRVYKTVVNNSTHKNDKTVTVPYSTKRNLFLEFYQVPFRYLDSIYFSELKTFYTVFRLTLPIFLSIQS